ncbi:MAG: hypothetical protein QW331_02700, partial [Candidatus Woesearchaeota archaeon]
MMPLYDFSLFLFWSIMLAVAGYFLVRSLVKIAAFLRVTEFVVGFIIMAVSTSLPELFVGINAALANNSALSLGNVIGSNIADVTLVAGIMILVAKKVKVKNIYIKRDAIAMILIAILPFILMVFGNELSRVDGTILMGTFFTYGYYILRERKKFHDGSDNGVSKQQIVFFSLLFMFCVWLLFRSSEQVVFYATQLSISLVLPPIFIGLFLVALGTSLPELVFEVTAAKTGYADAALGDIIGSVVANSALVLGVTAIISPI